MTVKTFWMRVATDTLTQFTYVNKAEMKAIQSYDMMTTLFRHFVQSERKTKSKMQTDHVKYIT